ncbi:hypothetical protein EV715DRAFT_276118 [Schizophyllum commune]
MSTSTPPPPPYPSPPPPYSTASSASSDTTYSAPPPYGRPTPPPPGVLDLWQLNADNSPNFIDSDISADVRRMFFAQIGPTGIQPPGPRASSSPTHNSDTASLAPLASGRPATMFSPASARSENVEPARSTAPSWGAAQLPSAVAPASPPTRAPPALPTHAPSNSNVSGASERFTSPGRQVRRSVVVTEVRPQG